MELKMYVFYDETDNLIFFAETDESAKEMVESWFLNDCGFDEVPAYERWGAYPIIKGDGPIII